MESRTALRRLGTRTSWPEAPLFIITDSALLHMEIVGSGEVDPGQEGLGCRALRYS
jgi:hypothetical protein